MEYNEYRPTMSLALIYCPGCKKHLIVRGLRSKISSYLSSTTICPIGSGHAVRTTMMEPYVISFEEELIVDFAAKFDIPLNKDTTHVIG